MAEPSILVIVARDQQRLLEPAIETFREEDEIHVLIDRRFGERRHRTDVTPVADRRRGDRRCHPDVQQSLRGLGWAVIDATGCPARVDDDVATLTAHAF